MKKTLKLILPALVAMLLMVPALAQSGSHLNTWNDDKHWVFDATNEIPASANGQNITITGAGVYATDRYLASYDMGAQGVHSLLHRTTDTTPVSDAAWSIGGTVAAPPTIHTSGSNLTSWGDQNDWVFDPNAEIDGALNGHTITITNAGANNGTYTADNFNASFNMGAQGVHNLLHCPNISTHGALGGAVAWAQGGTAAVVPTPPVNSAFTGEVRVLEVGDSITAIAGAQLLGVLQTEFPNASAVTVDDKGVSGSSSGDWLRGSANYNAAVAAANASKDTTCSLMTGTNDSKTPQVSVSVYDANLTNTVAGFFQDIPTLRSVVLQEQPFINSGSPWDTNSDASLVAYAGSYSRVSLAKVGTAGMHDFYKNNPSKTNDGVHPNTEGIPYTDYYWAMALTPYITAPPPLTGLVLSNEALVAGGATFLLVPVGGTGPYTFRLARPGITAVTSTTGTLTDLSMTLSTLNLYTFSVTDSEPTPVTKMLTQAVVPLGSFTPPLAPTRQPSRSR